MELLSKLKQIVYQMWFWVILTLLVSSALVYFMFFSGSGPKNEIENEISRYFFLNYLSDIRRLPYDISNYLFYFISFLILIVVPISYQSFKKRGFSKDNNDSLVSSSEQKTTSMDKPISLHSINIDMAIKESYKFEYLKSRYPIGTENLEKYNRIDSLLTTLESASDKSSAPGSAISNDNTSLKSNIAVSINDNKKSTVREKIKLVRYLNLLLPIIVALILVFFNLQAYRDSTEYKKLFIKYYTPFNKSFTYVNKGSDSQDSCINYRANFNSYNDFGDTTSLNRFKKIEKFIDDYNERKITDLKIGLKTKLNKE